MATIGLTAQLDKLFEQRAKMALKATQTIVSECIQESINDYYREKVFDDGKSNIPEVYQRTYRLLNSLIKTNIIKVGNGYQCEVKIDEDYLNYQYPGNPNWSGNIPATGRDILEWNNEDGSHGKTVKGNWKIWEQAMTTLGGRQGIMIILKDNLCKYGLKVI